jgi:SPP1 family predicted phage head-tail adaptor
MKPPAIGRLRHRLTLESVSRTPDGGGGASESWSTVATVWAEVTPVGGGESVAADAVTGGVSHEIRFRYRPGVGPSMRLRSGARVFVIAGAIDVDERRRWLKCLCLERDL